MQTETDCALVSGDEENSSLQKVELAPRQVTAITTPENPGLKNIEFEASYDTFEGLQFMTDEFKSAGVGTKYMT